MHDESERQSENVYARSHYESECEKNAQINHLSGPISCDIAIVSLLYPLSRDTFSAIPAIPQQGAIRVPGLLRHMKSVAAGPLS